MKLYYSHLAHLIFKLTCFIDLNFAAEPTIVPKNDYLVDLTHVLNNDTISWINTRQIQVNVVHNGTIGNPDALFWHHIEDIELNTHTGTHLDAPCTSVKDGWCVSDIPLEHLVDRPAVVIDTTEQYNLDWTYEISETDIQEYEKVHGRIEDGSVILLKTGWSRFWPNYKAYYGSDSNDENEIRYPGLSYEACKWISENRKVVGIGIESPALIAPKSEGKAGHLFIFNLNIWGIGNLPNLDRIPPKGATVSVIPLPLEQGSGCPCRVIANLNPPKQHRHNDL